LRRSNPPRLLDVRRRRGARLTPTGNKWASAAFAVIPGNGPIPWRRNSPPSWRRSRYTMDRFAKENAKRFPDLAMTDRAAVGSLEVGARSSRTRNEGGSFTIATASVAAHIRLQRRRTFAGARKPTNPLYKASAHLVGQSLCMTENSSSPTPEKTRHPRPGRG
jgi:hypothetical protein